MVPFQYVPFPRCLCASSEFDPLPPPGVQAGDGLYTFLRQNQVKATHFFIGMNILNNWNQFNTAFQTNQDDIAVHTWTHPHMTALSNADVVAQLGWTLQVIYNSTGGRLARYWRPPYGDTDLRVTAIAKEVFGLTTVIWNRECVLCLLYHVFGVPILLQHRRLATWPEWRAHSPRNPEQHAAVALRYLHIFALCTFFLKNMLQALRILALSSLSMNSPLVQFRPLSMPSRFSSSITGISSHWPPSRV